MVARGSSSGSIVVETVADRPNKKKGRDGGHTMRGDPKGI